MCTIKVSTHVDITNTVDFKARSSNVVRCVLRPHMNDGRFVGFILR